MYVCMYVYVVHLHFNTFCVLCMVNGNEEKKLKTFVHRTQKLSGEFHNQSRIYINKDHRLLWTVLIGIFVLYDLPLHK